MEVVAAATAVALCYAAWVFGSGFYDGYMYADEHVLDFHSEFNGETYEQIYDHAAPEFQTKSNQERVPKLLTAIHSKLGNARASSLEHIAVTFSIEAPLIITRYDTRFDNGEGVETFTWKREDGSLRLVQYNIESDAFALN